MLEEGQYFHVLIWVLFPSYSIIKDQIMYKGLNLLRFLEQLKIKVIEPGAQNSKK